MSLRKKNMILGVVCSLLLNAGLAVKAEVADFETPEYKSLNPNYELFPTYNPLDLINAAEAYNAGYTGKGITVGIYDHPVNFGNLEFSNKTDSKILRSLPNIYDTETLQQIATPESENFWLILSHGTFVSGIIAAQKDDVGIHGVAFDSNIYSSFGENAYNNGALETGDKTWQDFLDYSDVKVINNSWGEGYLGGELQPSEDGIKSMNDAIKNDKLLIHSSGNNGTWCSGVNTYQWIFDKELKNNIISVGALSGTAKRSDDTIITVKNPNSLESPITYFSNLALGMEENFILAAGYSLKSLRSGYTAKPDDDPWKYHDVGSGTSFSSPFVTGAAALVQQAFPYLSSKQLADVLLSTANNNINFSNKNYHITLSRENNSEKKYSYFTIYNLGQNKLSDDELSEIMNEAQVNFKVEPDTSLKFVVYSNVNKESIIGQGVVDAGKAVKGLGTLNARRLTAEDRNSNFTVSGEKCDQAIYTVDTAGYDSEWSNDISETRADKISKDSAEEDLRNRYNGYMNVTADNYRYQNGKISSVEPADHLAFDDYKIIMNQVTEAYNKIAEDNNLIGLHVGLQKKGDGVLTLSGNNTYLGSTIAAGGVLEINGSVAGDAWSVENGTIAGCGTINGNLYNNSNLQPGSLEFVAEANNPDKKANSSARSASVLPNNNTLTVKGDLSSTGAINFTANGDSCTKLVVEGTADVDVEKINIANMVLNTKYELIEADILNANSSSQPLSGLLSLNYNANSNSLLGSIDVGNNTNSALDDNQTSAMDALSNLYAANLSDTDKSGRILQLLMLDEGHSNQMLTALSNKDSIMAAGALQRLHAVNDAVSSHISAGSMDESIWFRFSRSRNCFDDTFCKLTGNSYIFGYDWKTSNCWKLGFLLNHNQLDSKSDFAKGTINDDRYGIYGSYSKNRDEAYIYVTRGHQKNELNRKTAFYDIESDHNSNITEVGAEFAHNISRKNSEWQFVPYINTQISRYSQSEYSESGDDLFAQKVDSFHNTYSAAEIGLRFSKKTTKNSMFEASIGYKRVFSGYEPEFNYSFVGDSAHNYKTKGNFDRNLFVASINSQQKQKDGWYFSEELTYEAGSHDHSLVFSLQLNKNW